MGAFILAALILICAGVLAFFWEFAEGMASAPQYDNAPKVVLGVGLVLAIIVVATHWLPDIGW